MTRPIIRPFAAVLAAIVVAGGCISGDTTGDEGSKPPPLQAWQEVQRRVAGEGGVTKQIALDWFATLFGDVPDAHPIELPEARISGTQAVRYALSVWDELSEEQRRAVSDVIGVPAEGSGGGGGLRSVGILGAPPATRSGPYQDTLDGIVDELGSRTGHRPGLPIVSADFGEAVSPPDWASLYGWAYPASLRDGVWEIDLDTPEACVVVVGEGSFSPEELRGILAHEAFHCLAKDAVGIDPYILLPAWLVEGQAAWVGETIAGGTGLASTHWQAYLLDQYPLYGRSYDAIGFYAHLENRGADVWELLLPMLEAGGGGAMGLVLGRAGSGWIASWPTGLSRRADWGGDWDTDGPGITGDARAFGDLSVGTEGVESATVPLVDQAIWNVSIDEGVDLLRVGAVGFGELRWQDGTEERFDGSLSSVYCLAEECTCEDGEPVGGLAEEGPPFDVRGFALGLTDVRAGGGRVELEGMPLDDACDELQVGFPDGRWVGVAVGGGTIARLESEAGADGVAVFELEVQDGAVTSGQLVYSANASSVAQGETEGMADLVITGDAPLGGTSTRVVAMGGTVHVEGTVTVEAEGTHITTHVSESVESSDEIGFSPQLATLDCVRGDFAIEGRQAQEAAGYASAMEAPFIAVRREDLTGEERTRLDTLMGRVEGEGGAVVISSVIRDGERLDTSLRASGPCL